MHEVDVLVALAAQGALSSARSGSSWMAMPAARSRRPSCSRARRGTARLATGSRSRAPGRSRRARWSRKERGGAAVVADRIPRSSSTSTRSFRPQVRELGLRLLGRLRPDAGRLLGPASVRTSSLPSSNRVVRRRFRPLRPGLQGAASAPRSSGGSAAERLVVRAEEELLAAPPAPAQAALERRSGGSNVFRVAMCAGPARMTAAADTTGRPAPAPLASISGSSGTHRR